MRIRPITLLACPLLTLSLLAMERSRHWTRWAMPTSKRNRFSGQTPFFSFIP